MEEPQPRQARYTHGHAEPVLRSHSSRTAENSAAYLLPHLRPGQRLLDLGCGPGTITADLALIVSLRRPVAGRRPGHPLRTRSHLNGVDLLG